MAVGPVPILKGLYDCSHTKGGESAHTNRAIRRPFMGDAIFLGETAMHNRFGEECRWQADAHAATHMESLQVILNCASVQSCGDCVTCSEKALDLFLKVARGCVAGNAGVNLPR